MLGNGHPTRVRTRARFVCIAAGPDGRSGDRCLCFLDRVNRNLAVGYIKEFAPAGIAYQSAYFRENIVQGTAAGGAYSTVTDLLRFGRALRSGELIAPELVEIVTSAKPELGSAQYGFGFGVLETGQVAAHSGGTYGANAHMEIGMGGQYTAVILSNYSGGAAFVLATRLQTIAGRVATARERAGHIPTRDGNDT